MRAVMILRRHRMDNGSVNTRQETLEPSTVPQSRCDWLYAGMLPHFHTATEFKHYFWWLEFSGQI